MPEVTPEHDEQPAADATRRGHRVLLVEFVNADQFPGRISHLFPFVRGYLAELNVPARWLRFGISTTNLLEHGRDEITLTPGELEVLLAAVGEHRPTLIIIDDPLAPEQDAAVRARAPGVEIRPQRDWDFFGLDGERAFTDTWELLRPEFVPLYRWEAGNSAAKREEIDNVYIQVARRCGHPRPLAGNPRYAALEGEEISEHLGCTFCSEWIEKGAVDELVCNKVQRTPVDWITRQIESLARERGAEELRPTGILFENLGRAEILETALATLRATGLAGSVKILLAVRTDEAVRVGRLIRAHYAENPGSEARVGVYACGIESFYEPDLIVFNKGTRPLDCFRAVNTFRALADELGERFSYTGLSFILHTPWVTPEGLHLNLGLIRFLALTRKEAGNMFHAKLRLHPRLPITRLAAEEGLIVEDDADSTTRMNRRKLFRQESPWRYSDERLQPVMQLFARYELLGNDELADDLTRSVEARVRELNRAREAFEDDHLIALLIAMIDVIRATTEVLGEEALLEKATALARERHVEAAARPAARRFRVGAEALELAELVRRVEPVLAEAGAPVAAVAGVLPDEVEPAVAGVEGLFHAFCPEPRAARAGEGTLVLGRDADAVARWEALHATLGDEGGAARSELERLRGVPDCCAGARPDGPLAWAAFARRLETEGPWPAALAPLWVPALGFVPCSAGCEAARGRYEAIYAALGCKAPGQHYLFSFDGPGDGELIPLAVTGTDEGGVSYDGPALAGELRRGERIEVLPGQLRIVAGGETIELLTATHGLWSTERTWHAEEWRELAAAAAWVQEHREPARPVTTDEAEERAEEPEVSAFSRWVGAVVESLAGELTERTGYRVEAVAPAPESVQLRLAGSDGPLDLTIEQASRVQRAFRRSRLFALSHGSATPPDTPAKVAAAETLLGLLDAHARDALAKR